MLVAWGLFSLSQIDPEPLMTLNTYAFSYVYA